MEFLGIIVYLIFVIGSRMSYFIFLEYFSVPDGIVFLLLIISLIFFKKNRKTIFSTYLAVNLLILSYALYDLFFIFLSFILLMRQPYLENYKNKKYVSTAYKIRESSVFKIIAIIFLLMSIKNYIYYGTNILSGITRPIKLSIEKRKLEKKTGELVWAVPYYHSLESRLTFRTKDYFPVDNLRELYRKKLSAQAEEYEKEMFDRLFPYKKDYEIKIYESIDPKLGYQKSPTYEAIINQNLEETTVEKDRVSIEIDIEIQGDVFKDEAERRKAEKAVYELYNYYASKKFLLNSFFIRTHSKDSVFIEFKKNNRNNKKYVHVFYPKNLWFVNCFKKYTHLKKKWIERFYIRKSEFKDIVDQRELRNYWTKREEK